MCESMRIPGHLQARLPDRALVDMSDAYVAMRDSHHATKMLDGILYCTMRPDMAAHTVRFRGMPCASNLSKIFFDVPWINFELLFTLS
jgi:hypothetical protein